MMKVWWYLKIWWSSKIRIFRLRKQNNNKQKNLKFKEQDNTQWINQIIRMKNIMRSTEIGLKVKIKHKLNFNFQI